MFKTRMRCVTLGSLVTIGVLAAAVAGEPPRRQAPAKARRPEKSRQADNEPPKAQQSPAASQLFLYVVRDPAVHRELGLSVRQVVELEMAIAQVDEPLWRLRDRKPDDAGQKVLEMVSQLAKKVQTILTPEQQLRLEQLVLQVVGLPALVGPAMVRKLELSDNQVATIRKVLDEVQEETAPLEREAAGDAESAAGRQVAQRRARGQQQILDTLSDEQRRRLDEITGKPFDVAQIQRRACRAPELREVAAWINSEALKLSKLKGKVVALHFWSFGCPNCRNNLPWYKQWHDKYSSAGLTVIGIHTPQNMAERDPGGVRAQVSALGIAYPVAVDRLSRNWSAWANTVWPSVYLIDKRGDVRFWWYGELNAQGSKSEDMLRRKIELLLAE